MTWHVRARFAILSALSGIVILGSGCNNLWEWTVDSESFDALMSDGREAIQAADYPRAEAKFAAAVALRPHHSEARFYLAKAAVLNSDVDVFTLVQTLTDDSPGSGATGVFDFPIQEANSVYRVNRVVLESLEPIRKGEVTEGRFVGADVDLDLAMAYTLRGILRLRDTNGDGTIDGTDASPEELGFSEDENGEYSIDGIDNIPPEDINEMIDDLNELLDSGGEVLEDVNDDDSGIDIEDLLDILDEVGSDISFYYVNTGVPGNAGEGDNDGDGRTDEECRNELDDDGDGLIDEDSRVAGCPPPAS
jgi:hypothetical protein